MNVPFLIAALGREPFGFTPAEVLAMTPHQAGLILCERDEKGIPDLPEPPGRDEPPLTRRQRVALWARLNRVPEFEAERVWKEKESGVHHV